MFVCLLDRGNNLSYAILDLWELINDFSEWKKLAWCKMDYSIRVES
jgi:hypothetical protein